MHTYGIVLSWSSIQILKTHFSSCGQRIRMLSKTMTPSPHPSTSCPWPLNPVTSHNNNNNNNSGLHACVHAAEVTEPFLQLTCLVVECESQQQFDLINGPQTILVSLHEPLSSSSYCVWFLCLLSVCLQHASLLRKLRVFFSIFGECQAPPRGLEYALQRFQSFSVDPCGCKYSWNDADEDVFARLDGPIMGLGPSVVLCGSQVGTQLTALFDNC